MFVSSEESNQGRSDRVRRARRWASATCVRCKPLRCHDVKNALDVDVYRRMILLSVLLGDTQGGGTRSGRAILNDKQSTAIPSAFLVSFGVSIRFALQIVTEWIFLNRWIPELLCYVLERRRKSALEGEKRDLGKLIEAREIGARVCVRCRSMKVSLRPNKSVECASHRLPGFRAGEDGVEAAGVVHPHVDVRSPGVGLEVHHPPRTAGDVHDTMRCDAIQSDTIRYRTLHWTIHRVQYGPISVGTGRTRHATMRYNSIYTVQDTTLDNI